MDAGDTICHFFSNSPKRQLALEKWVGELLEEEHCKRLNMFWKTRWVEQHEAFEVFVHLFEPLVCCLEEMIDSNEWHRDIHADAQSLFLSLSSFPFIAALMITKDVSAYTKALSIKLQGHIVCRYTFIVRAYREVEFVQSALKRARNGVEGFHAHVYDKALQVAA